MTEAADRAAQWAEDIRSRPLNDEQATELAKVYAALAAVEAQERIARALEALKEPLRAFEAYLVLTGSGPEPEKAVSQDEEPSDPESEVLP